MRWFIYINNEITIWEKLLKWMCEQQPYIQQNINKWNKNDFTVMERRLTIDLYLQKIFF